jgi:aspartyl-tRNA synthetase
MEITNGVLRAVCAIAGKCFPDEVPVIRYAEAMAHYGNDRPDLRFELKLQDASTVLAGSGFKVFADALAAKGIVKGICVPGGAKFTRKEIDAYTALVGELGAKGLAWCKLEGGAMAGGVAKFLSAEEQAGLRRLFSAADGDILFFLADKDALVNKALSALRVKLGKDLKLYDEERFAWCWVTDFPLLEWSEEEKRWMAMHHPFTSPAPADAEKLESDPGSVRARAYDIVCNGVELGGGSIRIHNVDLQQKVFAALGIGQQEAAERFGFLLDALRYGAPPHGGLALGLDRVAMMMIGGQSLRDVIAFPKTQRGICPLTNAPSTVDERQLAELDLKVLAPPKK